MNNKRTANAIEANKQKGYQKYILRYRELKSSRYLYDFLRDNNRCDSGCCVRSIETLTDRENYDDGALGFCEPICVEYSGFAGFLTTMNSRDGEVGFLTRNGNKKWLRMSAKRELNSFRKLANIEIEWLKRER